MQMVLAACLLLAMRMAAPARTCRQSAFRTDEVASVFSLGCRRQTSLQWPGFKDLTVNFIPGAKPELVCFAGDDEVACGVHLAVLQGPSRIRSKELTCSP